MTTAAARRPAVPRRPARAAAPTGAPTTPARAPAQPPRPSRRPTTTAIADEDLPPCPVDALDGADGPVEITFWHAMRRPTEDALVALTDAYNASQDKVR